MNAAFEGILYGMIATALVMNQAWLLGVVVVMFAAYLAVLWIQGANRGTH
jgi:uncharacterized membrane protein YgaE (UPF0421/DUF939 family)